MPPLPGLAPPLIGLEVLFIETSQAGFDFFAASGSHPHPVFFYVELAAGVHIGSKWVDTGIHPDSRVIMRLNPGSRIQGAGGRGGEGGIILSSDPGPNTFAAQAGGSGGAGNPFGSAGGTRSRSPGFILGNDGTSEAGGVGGFGAWEETDINVEVANINPMPGGDAMEISCAYEFYNGGEIWGGGGGGVFSYDRDFAPGILFGNASGAGGDPGEPGEGGYDADLINQFQAPAGNAIRLVGNGSANFRTGGSDPNLKGAVGA